MESQLSQIYWSIYWSIGTPLYGLYRPGGVLPYMGYIGMCGPKGYGFLAVLVINWVSILAILVINRVSIFAL